MSYSDDLVDTSPELGKVHKASEDFGARGPGSKEGRPSLDLGSEDATAEDAVVGVFDKLSVRAGTDIMLGPTFSSLCGIPVCHASDRKQRQMLKHAHRSRTSFGTKDSRESLQASPLHNVDRPWGPSLAPSPIRGSSATSSVTLRAPLHPGQNGLFGANMR